MKDKKERLIRGHRRESVLFTLPELQDLRGKKNNYDFFEDSTFRT
jgi:hypothetical protein